jgi:hypothetical protein
MDAVEIIKWVCVGYTIVDITASVVMVIMGYRLKLPTYDRNDF